MIRPPVKWYGGKRYLAKRIVEQFPLHRIYLEPFGGGASVLLNKPPVDVETYNDLDQRITRLFRVLRDRGEEFLAKARLTPYSQVEFCDSQSYPPTPASWKWHIVTSFVGDSHLAARGRRGATAQGGARGGMAGDVNAWWTAIEMLPQIIDRLSRVQIICQSAFEAIPRFDHKDGLIYCDPPYVHGVRSKGSTDVYGVEMSDSDHRELSELLKSCKSRVVLSGYPSRLYEELYGGWRKIEFDIANHAAGGKTKGREKECLWMNF